ncbi:MAG TPA: 3-oxoacyl-[acyl-carrier-protein] synthase III C-terminal domain-containing protein [Pirellulaceae bacterium]|jgi:3-oxoacyl-[acyl-carrier-protein] synthase-3|nr:3-oxoacyl-[acyl-carrier-protein] synthase III C-terminal domain-containing protein [Pirellulaceae bacterium]
MRQHFELAGVGAYLPKRVLTAEDVDRRAGLPEGWTRRRTGVLTRHECTAPETLATMAAAAMERAMADAKGRIDSELRPIDLIIDASTAIHRPIPCNAAHVQAALPAELQGVPCFDVHSTCLGFVVALNVANSLFAAEAYRTIAIVCSEENLVAVNWQEPESACVVGDGAAAAILTRRDDPLDGYAFRHQTWSKHLDLCKVEAGGHVHPPFAYTREEDAKFRFTMDGKRLIRLVAERLPPMTDEVLAAAEADRSQVVVAPHQASPKAQEVVRRLLDVPSERFLGGVEEFGNVASAGMLLALERGLRTGRVKRGDRTLMLGTSAGYSQAGLLFTL